MIDEAKVLGHGLATILKAFQPVVFIFTEIPLILIFFYDQQYALYFTGATIKWKYKTISKID